MRRCLLLSILVACAVADDDWRRAYVPADDAWRSVPQHLVFNNESEPETLDPATMTGVLEDRVAQCLFEGLVTNDPRTLEPRPGVAERWDVAPDGLAYTFRLRADARWSDGRPVTAGDFVASWRRVLAKSTASDYAYLLYPVVGAEDFHRGRLADPAQVGIAAADDRTLVVHLRAPCPWFLELCAFHTLLPVPIAVIERHRERWTRPEHLVGNGPFVLKSWDQRRSIVVERNAHYWDRAFVKLDRVTILPHDNTETAYKLFQSGEVHWIPQVPVPRLDEVRRRPEYYSVPYFGTYFYRLNVTRPPLDDVRVRRAIAWAIDRRAIAEQIARGGQVPGGSFCPPIAGYEPPPGPGLDVERARAELAASRYAGAVPPIELLFNTSDLHRPIAEAVAQQLEQALGLTITLRNSEWGTYLKAQDSLDYAMSRSSWIGDFGDPDTFFALFLSGGGNNKTGWSSPRYDALVTASQVDTVPASRWQRLREAERLLVEEECPIISVYTYVAQGLLDERVMGFTHNPRDIHPLKYVWLEP
jgi:oligopeptide transport system substrate-binding protein